eukprot:gb/GECH01004963.1/.p1 GENE.gb/GECH01004963.1/~~gb/GECH01004963.1/.p1  ORF type:complete len:415 (+),score=91.10 gb/GECH01004963.1/:1-1245(+)
MRLLTSCSNKRNSTTSTQHRSINSSSSNKPFSFEITHQSSKSRARVGKIHTEHGTVNTPAFVGVGTSGTLKQMDNFTTTEMGLELMFCNTYHMMIQPGTETVREAGGLHSFISRQSPIITDSGGFQVFSLAQEGHEITDELKGRRKTSYSSSLLKLDEEGVLFRSYKDGRKILLTPESSVDAQKDLGADIIIPLDELLPNTITPDLLKESLDRTHRWEQRSLERHLQNPQNQAMYSVVHGGTIPELRKESLRFLGSMPFDGMAIGGSLGRDRNEMVSLLADTVMPAMDYLPLDVQERPRHLLGIGDMWSLPRIVECGLDTFDSCYPTRSARHGSLFLSSGKTTQIKKGYWTSVHDHSIDKDCNCYTCQHYSASYLRHLFKANEPTAGTLCTIHNLHQMLCHTQLIREKILNNDI